MLFCSIGSLLAGYLLNEEASLKRICQNLSHPHLGWCLLKYDLAFFIMVLYIIMAFLKSWIFAVLLRDNLNVFWGFPASLYCIGNTLAAARGKGLFYTPWIVLMGIVLARNPVVFQGALTAFSVGLIITKNISLSVDIWLLGIAVFILLFTGFPESICWLSTIALTYIISGRHSPIRDHVNKIICKEL